MADEVIGGISIPITGDESDLNDALARATAKAQEAGQSIADALNKAYEGGAGTLKQALDQVAGSANTVADAAQGLAGSLGAYGDAAQRVIDKQADLDQRLTASQSALSELQSAFEAGAVSEATLARAADDLQAAFSKAHPEIEKAGSNMQEFSEHAQHAGDAAHEAHGGAHELLEGLLEFAGIEVTIEALKEFVTEAIEVYAHTEKIQISLGYLSGSASAAGEEIEHLKGFAMDLAVPFTAAAEAAQKFSASGLEFDQVNEVLKAVADTSAATGNSFETVAGKIDALSNNTSVSAKQLKTLKLTSDELAEAMGISADQIKTAWAGMDVADRAAAITTALEKWKGAGDAVAGSTEGQLQKVKNQWHETMDEVGAAIAPLVVQALPSLTEGIKGIVAVGAITVTGLKEVIDIVVGLASVVDSAATGFIQAFTKIASGDIKGAGQALSDSFAAVKAASSATWTSMTADAQSGAEFISKMYETKAKKAEESSDRDSAASARTGAAAALAAAEMKKAMEEVEKFGQAAQSLLDKIPEAYGDYVSKLQDGGATATSLLKNVSSELDKAATAMTNMRGEPLRAMQEWVDELKAAQDKLRDFADSDEYKKIFDQVDHLDAKFGGFALDIKRDFLDMLEQLGTIPGAVAKDGGALVKWLQEVQTEQDKLDKQTQATQKTMDTAYLKYEERTQSQTIPITATLAERFAGVAAGASDANKKLDAMGDNGPGKVLQLATAIGTLHLSIDGITEKEKAALDAFDHLIDSGTTSLPLIEGGWKAVSAAVAKLAQTDMPEAIRQQGIYVDGLIQAHAPQSDIIRAQEAMYANEIKLAQQQGQTWSSYAIALDEAKRHQQEHIDATGRMYEAYKDLQKIVTDTFKGVEDGIAAAIVDGKNLGDTLEAAGKKIAKEFIEDVLGMALKPLESSLKNLITNIFPSITANLGGLANIGKDAQKAVDDLGHSVVSAAAGFGQAGTAAVQAGGAATNAAEGMKTAGGAASNAASSMGSLMGTVGAVGSAISAVTGVIGLFQNAAMASTMKLVELNTRISAIVEQKELPLANQISVEQEGTLNDISTHTAPIPDISAHTFAAQQWLEKIANNGVLVHGAVTSVGGSVDKTTTAVHESATAVIESSRGLLSQQLKATQDAASASIEAKLAIDRAAVDAADAALAELQATGADADAIADAKIVLAHAIQTLQNDMATAAGSQLSATQLNTGAVGRTESAMRGVLETLQTVVVPEIQNEGVLGRNVQNQAATTISTNVGAAIAHGTEEQKGALHEVAEAVKESSYGSLTALFGIRDTTIAQMQQTRDQLIAVQNSLIAAGQVATAATLDAQINSLNTQISFLQTGISAVTSGTTATTTAIATASSNITGALGTVGQTISASTSAAIIVAQQASAAAMAQVGGQVAQAIAALPGLMPSAGGSGAAPRPGMAAAGWVNPQTGGVTGSEGFMGSGTSEAGSFFNSLQGGVPQWIKDAQSMAKTAGVSMPINVQEGAGGNAYVLYVDPDGKLGKSNSNMEYTAADTGFKSPGLDSWKAMVAALGYSDLSSQWSGAFAAAVGAAKTGFETAGLGVIPGSQLKSFDLGGYVPYDMTARVHAGERVLNPREAQAYGAGGGTQIFNISVDGGGFATCDTCRRQATRAIGDHIKSVTSNNQVRR